MRTWKGLLILILTYILITYVILLLLINKLLKCTFLKNFKYAEIQEKLPTLRIMMHKKRTCIW